MKKYQNMKHLRQDVEPIIKSKLPLASREFQHIVRETIRLIGEEKKRNVGK